MKEASVVANNPDVLDWLQGRLGIGFIPPFTTFGFIRDEQIVGAVIFHMWTVCDVEMGAAMEPGSISRRQIRELCRYAFEGEGLRRVTINTPVSNDKARRAAERLGFTLESIRPDFYPTEDAASYRLLKRDCRWLAYAQRS